MFLFYCCPTAASLAFALRRLKVTWTRMAKDRSSRWLGLMAGRAVSPAAFSPESSNVNPAVSVEVNDDVKSATGCLVPVWQAASPYTLILFSCSWREPERQLADGGPNPLVRPSMWQYTVHNRNSVPDQHIGSATEQCCSRSVGDRGSSPADCYQTKILCTPHSKCSCGPTAARSADLHACACKKTGREA